MVAVATLSLLLLAGFSAANVLSGTPATIEEFPSLVQIEFGYGRVWVQYAAGVILTNQHILTVAHCVTGPHFTPSLRRVRAGASQRGSGGVIAHLNSVHNHPLFEIRGFYNDISVVRLSSALTFGPTIQQARIIAQDTVFPALVPVTLASWGRTAQDAIWADRDLNSIALHTVGHEECSTIYSSLPIAITITPNMMCSGIPGENGRSFGIRDGGAPLFYDGIVVGLNTYGSPITDKLPLVATAVAPYTNWIVETAV